MTNRINPDLGSNLTGRTTAVVPAPLHVAVVHHCGPGQCLGRWCVEPVPGMECSGCHCPGTDALRHLTRQSPDVVLVDSDREWESDLAYLRLLRQSLPDTPILLATCSSEPAHVLRGILGGADGYLQKPLDPHDLLESIRQAADGRPTLSPQALSALISGLHQANGVARGRPLLSAKEEQVMVCLLLGYREKEMPDLLGIGQATVHTYTHRIFKKLNARTKTAAIERFFALDGSQSGDGPSPLGGAALA